MNKIFVELLIVFLIYMTFCFPRWCKKKGKLFWNTIMYIYLYGIFATTFLPAMGDVLGGGTGTFGTININLIPFRDWINQVGFYQREIIINVLVFIPFGILLGFQKTNKVQNVLVLSLLLSLFIEVMQGIMTYVGIFTRISDVTDLITNTIGGVLGYLIYRLVRYFFRKVFK